MPTDRPPFIDRPWPPKSLMDPNYLRLGLGLILVVSVITLATMAIGTFLPTSPNLQKADQDALPTVAPLAYAKADSHSIVRASLPEAIKTHPSLHNRLYREIEVVLTAFAKEAASERSQSQSPSKPYRREQVWAITVESQRLISLYAYDLKQTYEPEPTYGYQTVLWDKQKNELISAARLLNPRADTQFVQSYLCQALDQKRAQNYAQTNGMIEAPCPSFQKSRFVLTPSTMAGKSAGISLIFAAGEIQTNDKETYFIPIPLDLIAPLLLPPYHEEFGGLPVGTQLIGPHNAHTELSAPITAEDKQPERVSSF